MMEAREVKTKEDLRELVQLAEQHPKPEYDCEFVEYVMVLLNFFKSPTCRMWLLYNEKENPVGYVIGERQLVPSDMIFVPDILIQDKYRGNNNIQHLTNKIMEWAKEEDAKRVLWTSEFDVEKWRRILNLPLKQKNIIIWEVE